MRFSDFGSAPSRRIVALLGMVAVLATASVARAQDAPAAPAAPAGPDQFLFKSDIGLITWQVKADKVVDFESSWVAIRTKLAASAKPELKALADGLRMYKVEVPPQTVPSAGPIFIYYFIADPASKTNSYDPSKLLYEADPELFPRAEADVLFNKLAESLAGIGAQPMKRIQ